MVCSVKVRDAKKAERTVGELKMRSTSIAFAMALIVFAYVAPSTFAEEELEVLLMMPTYGEAVFGEIEVEAEVYPPETKVARWSSISTISWLAWWKSRPSAKSSTSGKRM